MEGRVSSRKLGPTSLFYLLYSFLHFFPLPLFNFLISHIIFYLLDQLSPLKKHIIITARQVLYIGAAAGTTVSHVSDIVGPSGCVYAVEFAHRPGRDLINMAKSRTNVIPIIEDARHPLKYRYPILSYFPVLYRV